MIEAFIFPQQRKRALVGFGDLFHVELCNFIKKYFDKLYAMQVPLCSHLSIDYLVLKLASLAWSYMLLMLETTALFLPAGLFNCFKSFFVN